MATKDWDQIIETASDALSETTQAGRAMAQEAARSKLGKAAAETATDLERMVGDKRTNVMWRTMLLAGAGLVALTSLGLAMTQRKHESLMVGQLIPPLMIVALWTQIVRD